MNAAPETSSKPEPQGDRESRSESDRDAIDATVGRTTRAVSAAVIAFTGIYAVTAIVLFAPRVAVGVVVGGVVACLNFVVLARVGRAITQKGRDAALWGVVYLVKVIVLFGGFFLLLRSGVVGALGVIVGFSALLPGIVVGGLLAGRASPGPEAPADPTSPADATRDDDRSKR